MSDRRQYTTEFKLAVITDAKATSVPEAAAKHNVKPGRIHYWLKGKKRLEKKNGNSKAVTLAVPKVRDNKAHDATLFLRHAKKDMLSRIRAGALSDLDRAHLLALLALDALDGK